MNLGYTIHTIHRGKEVLPVNAVVDFGDEDFADLLKVGAIREPTAAEVELYGLTHRPVDPKQAVKQAAKAAKSTAIKTDGPTVAEWVAAGYQASNYPPSGYASRSTEDEIAAAVAAQKAAPGNTDPDPEVEAPLV